MELEHAFGKVLRERRLANKLSQEKLAHLANLDRTYIGLIERGERSPTIKSLFAIAEALNNSPHILIKETENKQKAES